MIYHLKHRRYPKKEEAKLNKERESNLSKFIPRFNINK